MLGKRNRRASAFSICHAGLLAVFIVLGQVMVLVSADADLRLSGRDVVTPMHVSRHHCVQVTEGLNPEMSCAVIFRAVQEGEDTTGIARWRFGFRL